MTLTPIGRLLAAHAALGALLTASGACAAQPGAPQDFHIPAGPLDRALIAFADQSGQQVLFGHADAAGRSVPAVAGRFAPDALLARLLAGSGLVAAAPRPGVIVLKPAPRASRILAVLQSPSQLRAEYGPDLAEEIVANCGVEIAFTPKELKIANELSERLGTYTYAGRSKSRPSGLSSGRRSQTESEQRRALMLPQELLQMPKDQLLVLRGGIPPVRGRKLVYYRDRAFAPRRLPPPAVPKMDDAQAQGRRIQAIALEVASLRGTVEDIRARVVDRPMTVEEAAGETPLSAETISLTLEHVDMEALAPDAPDPEVRRFMREYLEKAAGPASKHASQEELPVAPEPAAVAARPGKD